MFALLQHTSTASYEEPVAFHLQCFHVPVNPKLHVRCHFGCSCLNAKTCIQVIEKRATQQLEIRKARKHIVEGFLMAVDDLDNVVKTIRAASDGRAAKDRLQQQLSISEEQADAVLNMSLRRLTGLAVDELRNEEQQLNSQISDLTSLLADRVCRLHLQTLQHRMCIEVPKHHPQTSRTRNYLPVWAKSSCHASFLIYDHVRALKQLNASQPST
jgi:hypothetical protein